LGWVKRISPLQPPPSASPPPPLRTANAVSGCRSWKPSILHLIPTSYRLEQLIWVCSWEHITSDKPYGLLSKVSCELKHNVVCKAFIKPSLFPSIH
jgi:hypothetical protein